jgi:hypothetical protein
MSYSGPPPEPPNDRDWAKQVADRVEQGVALVRDHTLGPATRLVRLAVWGVVAFAVALALLVLGTIGLVRLLDDLVFAHRIWITDLVLGGIFTGSGMLLIRQGGSATPNDSRSD